MVADGDGGFRFLRPNGEPLPAVPPAPRWEGVGSPLAPTVERLAAAGISIGPDTATPEWYGESLNVAAALDVLWQPPAAAAREEQRSQPGCTAARMQPVLRHGLPGGQFARLTGGDAEPILSD